TYNNVDGTFKIVGLPSRGLVGVRANSTWRLFGSVWVCCEPIARFADRLDLTTQRAEFLPQRLDVDIDRPLQNHSLRHDQSHQFGTAENSTGLTAQYFQEPGLRGSEVDLTFARHWLLRAIQEWQVSFHAVAHLLPSTFW